LRIEKQFVPTDEVRAAAGIKIVAPELENVGAGSPLIVVENEKEIEEAKVAVQQEIQEVEFTSDREGVVLKADTLGSLEAMIKLVEDASIPVRKAEVGCVTKQDIIEVQNLKEEIRKAVLAFNVKILEDAELFAKDLGVTIFSNNIIYRLIDEYKEWSYKAKEREIQEKLTEVSRPCEIKVLKGFVFRASNPAIFGVEVRKGLLKPGVRMRREDGKEIGVVKTIEKEGQQISEAKTGDKVAISMSEPTIGRQIEEGNVLITVLTETDLRTLRELFEHLSADERELLKEYS
jgi:translation initiation factor 5B